MGRATRSRSPLVATIAMISRGRGTLLAGLMADGVRRFSNGVRGPGDELSVGLPTRWSNDLACGFAEVVCGFLLLCDSRRVLLSRLLAAPDGPLAEAPLQYAALALLAAGLAVCAAAALGCWATYMPSYVILTFVLWRALSRQQGIGSAGAGRAPCGANYHLPTLESTQCTPKVYFTEIRRRSSATGIISRKTSTAEQRPHVRKLATCIYTFPATHDVVSPPGGRLPTLRLPAPTITNIAK
ncbi:hypothetical protein MSG28_011338 [Choristoneura fumiferana]|uniref:Uncharacterized protein n=1 Tax=Choristoneura fumiferana TaxID=7141 RepID=A0ACC0JMX0_CHOFU|nr:hypothetical protein MSG28_011338 [Choristoneura fumiferana]